MTSVRPAEPVAVVGTGVVAPGGLGVDELWRSLLAARSFAEPYVDPRLPPDARALVARVAGFDPTGQLSPVEVRRTDRTHQLAVAAARQALDEHTGELPPPERCAVVCGVGMGAATTYEQQHDDLTARGVRGMSPLAVPVLMPSSTAAVLSIRFGFTGPCLTVTTACASGTTAIGEGAELLRRGAADLVLAGGADCSLSYPAVCGFLRLDALSRHTDEPALASRPFDVDRDGFVLGEGAGFVVLVRARDAAATGAPVLATVTGYASTADAHHVVAPDPSGASAVRCMGLALHDAGAVPFDVAHVNAHGTSTPAGDLAEATALRRLFGDHTVPVTAVKGTTGHCVAASGAIEAVVVTRSLRHRVVPPVAGLREIDPKTSLDVVRDEPRAVGDGVALSTSFGFGGANACLVLAAP
jgi:3-oxoacyl-[acyl-carrier-protein] synthase II